MTSVHNEQRSRNVFRADIRLPQVIRILLALPIMACEPTANHERVPVTEESHAAVAQEVHWGYEGKGAPEHWANLLPEFALCSSGVEQSPVDLTGAVPIEEAGIERRLGETVLTVTQRARVMDLVDNGHTIQVTSDMPMSTELGGVRYELVQFHFHAPSEHTIVERREVRSQHV